MRKGIRVTGLGMIAVLALVMAIVGCSHEPSVELAKMAGTVIEVRSATVASPQGTNFEELVGVVVPRNRAEISTKIQARVDKITVRLGSYVRQGELLAEFDMRDIRAKEEQAEALNSAWSQKLKRYDELFKGALVSKEEYDQIKAQADVAAAGLSEIRAMLSYARVVSPFAGKVTRKDVDLGDLTSPGQPLFVVDEEADLRAQVAIPEELGSGVSLGDSLGVFIPSIEATVRGSIVELSESADPATHSFTAKIALPALEKIRSGQYCKVQIPTGKSDALLLDTDGILRRGQLEVAYVIGENQRVSMRLIRTGRTRNEGTEVLSGLQPNERVAISGLDKLTEGDSVRVMP